MKFSIFLTILSMLLTLNFHAHSQSNTLSLDGIDDYVDLGNEAGNGIRTIELWFKPSAEINSDLSNLTSLITRFTTIQNIDHFSLSFQPSNLPNPGSLRFNITLGIGEDYSVYSDITSWQQGIWYHVAAVVDQVSGMSIYIDGKKQSSTNPYNSASASNDFITTVGCWGSRIDLDRFFGGNIEDVRFSNESIYNEDFIPECPDIAFESNTIGVWNFNEMSGDIAIDSSANLLNAEIIGAERISDLICLTSNVYELNSKETFIIFPNPASNTFSISTILEDQSYLVLFNSLGQEILREPIKNEVTTINTSRLHSGNYIWTIRNQLQSKSGKIMILNN